MQLLDYISHTPPNSFFMGVLVAVIYWSSSLSPMSHFFFQTFHVNMLKHLFSASMAFSLFTFVVWTTFFMLFSHYFLIFKSHLHNYFFLLNINVLLVICWPHNSKGINDRLTQMPLICNLFHHFHNNEFIYINMFLDCALDYG